MINVELNWEGDFFSLQVTGHAPVENRKTKVNEICAAVSTLSNTFYQSVCLLCSAHVLELESEKGKLKVRWSKENLETEKHKDILIVLIRALQIGLENCRRIDTKSIKCEYKLKGLIN